MSFREKRRLRIDDLPHDLNEALDELEKDDVIIAALGTHIATNFIEAKRQEWRDYITQVTRWEVDNYSAEILTRRQQSAISYQLSAISLTSKGSAWDGHQCHRDAAHAAPGVRDPGGIPHQHLAGDSAIECHRLLRPQGAHERRELGNGRPERDRS
jgi:hypothetical protein